MPPSPEFQASTDEDVIQQVRREVFDLVTPFYDTKWNYLRWLQANDFNPTKTVYTMRKHLKWRKERKLDEDCSGLQRCLVAEEFAPLSIIGPNRENGDHLIVVDHAGKVDVGGVMKSVQPTQYLHHLFRNFENILRLLMKMEESAGKQCSVYYIYDMEGLAFDPSMISIVTANSGPFRVSWQLVGSHYREFIDKFVVINAPSYINILWSALCQFIPEQAKNKIMFTTSNYKLVCYAETREELKNLADPAFLPDKYGGLLSSDTLLKKPQPVPKSLYWKPRPDYPPIDHMHRVNIPAGKHRDLTYKVEKETMLLIYNQHETELTIAIYYAENESMASSDWDPVFPCVPKCALAAVDCQDYFCELPGLYHFRIANEGSWIRSATFKIIVHDKDGKEIHAVNEKEKWIKLGSSK